MNHSLYFELSNSRIGLGKAILRTKNEVRVAKRGCLISYDTTPFRWIPCVCALSMAFVRTKELFLRGELFQEVLLG